MANNPQQTTPSPGSGQNTNLKKQSVSDFLGNVNDLMSKLRARSLPNGAEPPSADGTTAKFAPTNPNSGQDWRVKISLPDTATFRTSPILQPLVETNNSVVFPVTPQITVNHIANYDSLDPVHSNYPFPQYVNSRVEDITISGEFPVQHALDGEYWVAATHFFKSVTKMAYGETSNKGAPPALVKLNGYGDFVFNNVPCVVTNFTFNLENGVDYIQVPVKTQEVDGSYTYKNTYVPTTSMLTVSLKPTYSRGKVEQFSLDKFINGELADKGFI